MDHQASITESDLECMLFDETAEPKPLPFSLLERITNGFSYKMEIGRGGFAVVYKAMLEKGAVAVKRLSNAYMYEKEFFGEVECLMKVKHKNIIRFLGYCVDTQGHMRMYEGKYVMADIQQRLLCFEYCPNGSLDHYIKDPSCGLEWIDRYDIIKGICEGLHHLHELNIVHLDLKPANILLDENMEPKITDFGISRSFEEDQTRAVATKVRGTIGYMAPEFVTNLITKKYDLYSLGVIIIEILTGDKRCQGVESVLQSWINRLDISQRDKECEQIRVCVGIGIECTNFDQAKRPANMKHIIERFPEIKEISPRIQMLDIGIISSSRSLHSLDTNHTKQWIITGEDNGHVRIWNYQTQKKVDSFKLSERSKVVCVKFIARKQWFAAASGYSIYVYSYETKMQKITSINAGSRYKTLHTLAVHPTKSYLLSSDYGNIKLWNWDKNWECTHIFEANNSEACIYHIAFSSKGTVAGASLDCTVKVCSLDSLGSNYTLSGHSRSVKCLDFFTWDKEYLITGSDDHTTKIWDMEQKICLCTLNAFKSPVMFVLYRPDLQILITCSEDGSIYLWRIFSRILRRPPKLDQTVNIGGGRVLALACSMGRVVIAKEDAVLAIMDIDCVNSRDKSMDYSQPQLSAYTRPDGDETSKVIAGSSEELPILDIHPLELCASKPDEPIMCSLYLTNKTDGHVAFRIREDSREFLRCSSKQPMFGTMLPRSTYTLVVKTGHKMKLGEETHFNLALQSSTLGERYMALFISNSECDEFFEEAEEIGNTVYEVTLKAIYSAQRDTTSKTVEQKIMKPIFLKYPELLYSLDAHPTQPWIAIGHSNGNVSVWNHESQITMTSFKISKKAVCSIKFHATRNWIVAVTRNEFVHVYDCVCVTQIQEITTFRALDYTNQFSMAIHPIKPYVLSSSLELWDGDKAWQCTHKFGTGSMIQLVFNPEDPNSFASVPYNDFVEVWSLDSPKPEYTLYGHSDKVKCLDFFKCGDRQYLITGSRDCTAKIWDLQKRACIHTMEGFMSPVIYVISIPGRPYLVTCLENATVHVWSSTDFRLKTTINFRGGGKVQGLACLMGSRRIAIGQYCGISIVDIDDEEGAGNVEPSWDDAGAGLGYNLAGPHGRDQIERHDYTSQQSIDPTWSEMGAGFRYNLGQPQAREQMQHQQNSEIWESSLAMTITTHPRV